MRSGTHRRRLMVQAANALQALSGRTSESTHAQYPTTSVTTHTMIKTSACSGPEAHGQPPPKINMIRCIVYRQFTHSAGSTRSNVQTTVACTSICSNHLPQYIHPAYMQGACCTVSPQNTASGYAHNICNAECCHVADSPLPTCQCLKCVPKMNRQAVPEPASCCCCCACTDQC
jgi:hypothetical protein